VTAASTSRSPRLHLLMVTGSYAPDHTGMAPLNTELCEYLVAQGHHVSVATVFPHYPEWKLPAEFRHALWRREIRNGVHLYRGFVYVPSKRTAFHRILYDTSIGLSTTLRSLPVRAVDLVLAVSPPLQAGLAGCVLSWLKAAPLVLQVQDLVPDLAIALGMLRNPWAIRLARILEAFVYRRSDIVLVICEGFAANLRSRAVPDSKIRQIPHWVDMLSIRPELPLDDSRRAYQIDDSAFLVLHTGNLGAKQKLENVLEAACCLRDLPDVRFCLVGEGTEKARLEQHARHLGLSNVGFLPLLPRESIPSLLATANVLLLNQAARVVDMVIPSKLLTYLAAGRPVIAAVPSASEAARCLEQAGAGLVVAPENPTLLAAAIRRLYENRPQAIQMGRAARHFAELNFDSDRILPRFEALFASMASLPGRSGRDL